MSVAKEFLVSVTCDRKAIFRGPWHCPLTVVRNPTIKYMNVKRRKGPALLRVIFEAIVFRS